MAIVLPQLWCDTLGVSKLITRVTDIGCPLGHQCDTDNIPLSGVVVQTGSEAASTLSYIPQRLHLLLFPLLHLFLFPLLILVLYSS